MSTLSNDEFEDAIDSHEQALQLTQNTDTEQGQGRSTSPSKKKKNKKKNKKSKQLAETQDSPPTADEPEHSPATRAETDPDTPATEAAQPLPQQPKSDSAMSKLQGFIAQLENDSKENQLIAMEDEQPTPQEADIPQESTQVDLTEDAVAADPVNNEVTSTTQGEPLGESTQQYEVTEDDLKESNKALEEKLDMLKIYDDDDEDEDGEQGQENQKAQQSIVVENPLTEDKEQNEVTPNTPTSSGAPPSLPPRGSPVLPSLPSRAHIATTPVAPPALPPRADSTPRVKQADLSKAAAELPPPPLPPQLTDKQKQQHHRGGSIFQSWFTSTASRGSTTPSLSEKSITYDENYDLLLSRLNENTEDLTAKDDLTREQINSTHDTLKSSFAEHVSRYDEENNTSAVSDVKIDWAFWSDVVNDYSSVAKSDPSRLSKELCAGIPHVIRGIVWQLVANSNPIEFEGKYESLCQEESKYEKNILKDLGRTSFVEKAGVDKEALCRVIRAYSNLDAEVGYTQGMAFIAVPLLMNMSELEAFTMLHKLMFGYGLRTLFLPEMPGLLLKMYQFDRLVEDLLPALYAHLQRQGVRSSMYASQWFLTFFAYKFPLEIVLRIFDIVITEGIESILKFAIALVQKNEKKLLTLKFDELLEFLKDQLFYAYLSTPIEESDIDEDIETGHTPLQPIDAETFEVDQLVENATEVKLLPITLKRFEEEWEEIHREEKERREEVEELRLRNNHMKKEIRKVEASYTILNREHVQIANEMIAGRMKIADLEDENKDLKLQNTALRERVKTLQNPINEDVPVPASLEEDLKNTMERNLEVMTKNQELEEQMQGLIQEIEDLKAQLEAEKSKSTTPVSVDTKPPSPHKTSSGGLWGKKLFK